MKPFHSVSLYALSVALLAFAGCAEPEAENPSLAVRPEIAAFLTEHPEYGSVEQAVAMPDWAKGVRQQVHLTSGSYLFYLQDGQVVTVYKYEGETRAEIYRRDIPDPPKNLGPRTAVSGTPAYRVLDTVDMTTGGRYGEILIASFSRQTPAAERESTLRTIMTREGFSRADLYCSEEAKRANSSSSYAASHPNALKTCFMGSIQDGAFTPGEALY